MFNIFKKKKNVANPSAPKPSYLSKESGGTSRNNPPVYDTYVPLYTPSYDSGSSSGSSSDSGSCGCDCGGGDGGGGGGD